MKQCPRCDSSLSHYALRDVEAYGCDSCGWVGVDVEHRSEPVRIESWQDAMSRFYQKFRYEELPEHAQKLERVEAERKAAIAGNEAETESETDATSTADEDPDDVADEPQPTAAVETTADEAAADTDDVDDEDTVDDDTLEREPAPTHAE
ncbi:zf-TFIIB domain-containing protein [Haloarchaeobius sp. DFWS5]|uniref:TFIIB-type zinc ribbon-containing protein n=1 Tax=Haloarchaeobius sp. DFWS5 TaxID=3446114 RepID=UPI003EBD4E3E